MLITNKLREYSHRPKIRKIREYLARRLILTEIVNQALAMNRLASIGFLPTLIFDVGAYKGEFTKSCLQIWPQARVACFEALPEKVSLLQEMERGNSNIQIFPGLVGAEIKDEVPFHAAEDASSVLTEHVGQDFPLTLHPMRTIDQTVEQYFDGRCPDLLKLDVQGYELEVLKGAEHTLNDVKVILAEVNLLDIHQHVPLLAELVAWLDERDLVAYDICGFYRRPLDQALWQADFIFVQKDSPFRSDKRWQCIA